MNKNKYKNFVRESSKLPVNVRKNNISGEEAKRLYLEEIAEEQRVKRKRERLETPTVSKEEIKLEISNFRDKDLFIAAQNNDVGTLVSVLDKFPDKLNTTDEFGWSLLMIACQANSVDTVKELLKRNADTSIRDKAGNSVLTLVIRNRNLVLVDLFLNKEKSKRPKTFKREKIKREFLCEICNRVFDDRDDHLSSTVHNMDASKRNKCRPCYKIPASNKGYQIMVKGGWDRSNGLGPDGTGNLYPIRTIQKLDKKGLGLEKLKKQKTEDFVELNRSRKNKNDYHKNRRMEIDFRREFY